LAYVYNLIQNPTRRVPVSEPSSVAVLGPPRFDQIDIDWAECEALEITLGRDVRRRLKSVESLRSSSAVCVQTFPFRRFESYRSCHCGAIRGGLCSDTSWLRATSLTQFSSGRRVCMNSAKFLGFQSTCAAPVSVVL